MGFLAQRGEPFAFLTVEEVRRTDLVEEYLNDRRRAGELAESSIVVIRGVLHSWAAFIGETDPDEWTADDVWEWVNGDGLRAATRKSRLTKLRPYLRWLRRKGFAHQDPSEGLGRISIPKGDPRDLDAEDVAALLEACPDERALLIVTLMLQMGLRCGDVARIRLEDIDVRRRSLHVRAKGGRGEPTHWEPIPAEAWELLSRELRGRRRASGPLVTSYTTPGKGLQAHSISKLVGRWIRDAGLKEFPHDGRSAHALRHTCAQDMLDAGASLRDVQHALGHSTIRSTEIYTRREPAGLREALEGRRYAHQFPQHKEAG